MSYNTCFNLIHVLINITHVLINIIHVTTTLPTLLIHSASCGIYRLKTCTAHTDSIG